MQINHTLDVWDMKYIKLLRGTHREINVGADPNADPVSVVNGVNIVLHKCAAKAVAVELDEIRFSYRKS